MSPSRSRGKPTQVFVDIPSLNEWLMRLNWAKADLASKADISRRTVMRLFRQGNVSVNVHKAILASIANEIAFEKLEFVAPKSLALDSKRTTLEVVPPGAPTLVTLTFDANFNTFSKDQMNAILKAIHEIMGAEAKVVVKNEG